MNNSLHDSRCWEKRKLRKRITLILRVVIFLALSSSAFAQTRSSRNSIPPQALCAPPVCTISGSTTICPGSSTLLCAPVGLASYSWSTGATTQCISVTTPGTYIVTVGSTGGCTSTCNVTTTALNCSITGNTSICSGGSTNLCAMAGGSSYVWSNGSTSQCISVSSAGTYSVTVCINGCYMTCSKTVTVTNVSCTISGNSTFCSGGSTQLCAPSGMSSYQWSNGENSRCITVSSGGTYTVTVSNGSCSSSCSKTVSMNPPLNCSITGNSIICPGGSTTLCLPPGYSYSWNTGATTQCISVTTPGTYYGNINDGTCNTTCNKTVTLTSINCSISGSNTICPGSTTQLCGPSGQSSYLWSTGATTQCINVNAAGTYSLTVSNGTCSSNCSKTLTSSNPNCTITGNTTACANHTTQLCGPSGQSSYNWSTGETTQCITVATTGTYTLNVTNGGCSSSCSKNVTINPPLNCAITGNTNICAGNTTQLCLPSGYASYSWNTGATTQCITVSATGTYYGNVNNGTCNSTCYKAVTVTPINCTITGNTNICQGGSTELCAPSGMTSYNWSTGATSRCITVTNAGTYSVTVSNGTCTSSCDKTVTVTNNLNCAITGANTCCSMGTTTICATPGMSSYLWSNGATTACINVPPGTFTVTISNGSCTSSCSKCVTPVLPPICSITGLCNICPGGSTQLCGPAGMSSYSWSTGETTQCITVSTAGTYTLTISNGSCISVCSAIVTVTNMNNCSITGNNNICPGGTTQLCASPGMSSYLWNTGATTQCITVGSGTYFVTATNGNCSSTCSKTVTTNSPPSCNITGNSFICNGAATQLCASGGSSYTWSTGATTQCISVNSSANYSVIVSDGSGCISTCSKAVFINTPPTCNITGSNSLCQGGTTQLCATPGMASYEWSTGATTECITVNSAATYSVIVTDAHGCSSVCSKTITVNNPSCTITGNGNLCGGTSQLCGPAGANSYMWNTGAVTQCINTTTAGTYTLTTNQNGCVSTCSKVVTAPPTCSISGCATVSPGSASSLCAQAPTANTFAWSTGSTSQCISVNNTGTYTVTITDVNGCSSTCSQTEISQICYASPTNTNVTSTQTWTINTTAQTATIRTTFAKTFVDNTYGTNAIGWSNGHTFSNLTGSDHVQLALYDLNNVKKMEFKIDYISASSAAPSGYKTLGVSGGDGGMIVGSSSDIVSAKTSLDANFNEFGYVLTSNSPATNANYAPNASYPNWIYDVWYEVTVRLSAFPAGFGKPLISDVHASPSKTGHNTEIVVDTVCIPCVNPLNLGNLVWFDTNKNGLKDANELGLNNYTVKLYTDNNNDNLVDGASIASTTTNASGIYGFNGLIPGNYIVGVVLKTGDTVVVINGGDPDNDIDNDNNGINLVNNEIRSKSVSLNFGTEPTNDGDGFDGNLAVDFAIYRSTPDNEKCYTGVSHHYVYATQSWTVNTVTNVATIRTTFSKNFVDNTYGSNAVSWPNGHTFSNLTGSDKLQLALYDVNHVKKMEFKLDYISASSAVPSGYKSLGVSGGDGGMVLGSASDIVSYKTSLDANFNDLGYVLTTNSPATNANYAPNATYPNWIYDVWYEVTVRLSAFPAGFLEPIITEIHASPSKTGTNTEVMDDTICVPQRRAAVHEIVENNNFSDLITINAYPNPFNEKATVEFSRADKSSHVLLEVYNLSGAKVATLFDGIAEAGQKYVTVFNPTELSDGIYIYRMENEDHIINGKLILIK